MTRPSIQAEGVVLKKPVARTPKDCDPFVEVWIALAPQPASSGKKPFSSWCILRLFGTGMKKAVNIDVGDTLRAEGHADVQIHTGADGVTRANIVVLSSSFTKV